MRTDVTSFYVFAVSEGDPRPAVEEGRDRDLGRPHFPQSRKGVQRAIFQKPWPDLLGLLEGWKEPRTPGFPRDKPSGRRGRNRVGDSRGTTSRVGECEQGRQGMNGELGGRGGELSLGQSRWVWQGRNHSRERSGLETEMREGDITRDEVTWRTMVGIWREGVRTRPKGPHDGESQCWLHLSSIRRAWESYERAKAPSRGA